jgi:pyruvate/2-oxoglutarate/acetoin dehydrogenase E1 component
MGAAQRGLRPIADIQYLDYLIYGLQGLSDDVATLHYRSAGGQLCPLIVRTKGHRLEGIWHSGSPLGMLLSSLRGMHLCVPRNSVQAVGMYTTLLHGDDPAVVIEVLNGYRLKEACPTNLGSFTVPLGKVEILHLGSDITVVTYGACIRVVESALSYLHERGISVELIDVQTLLPFDRDQEICASIAKTNAVLFCDEDVPGGASAYMLQQVLEGQRAYEFLDAPPRTLTAKAHRGAYGSDGDYYSKPNREDVIAVMLEIMRERRPTFFP